MNDYYDIKIKQQRLNMLKKYTNFSFIYGDLKNTQLLKKNLKNNINYIYHFAGQAGVRYSIRNLTNTSKIT